MKGDDVFLIILGGLVVLWILQRIGKPEREAEYDGGLYDGDDFFYGGLPGPPFPYG